MNFFKLNELAIEFRFDIGIKHTDSIDFFPVIANKLKNLTIVFLDMDLEISGACCKFDAPRLCLSTQTILKEDRPSPQHMSYTIYSMMTPHLQFVNSAVMIKSKKMQITLHLFC